MISRRSGKWAVGVVEEYFMLETRRHLLLFILLLSVSAPVISQVKHPSQSAQGKARTNQVTRKRELTPRQIASLAYPSSVSIYALSEDGGSSSGTGFFVAPGLVATCYHVVEDAKRILITRLNDSENKYTAQLLRYDAEKDVALLAVKTLRANPLRLSHESDFYIGDTIYTIGNPKGLEGTFSNGLVSNFLKVDDTFYMQFTAPVSPGSSGGPVIDKRGEVIGMVNMQLKEGQNLNFAIMSIHLRVLVDGGALGPGSYVDSDLGPPPSRPKPN